MGLVKGGSAKLEDSEMRVRLHRSSLHRARKKDALVERPRSGNEIGWLSYASERLRRSSATLRMRQGGITPITVQKSHVEDVACAVMRRTPHKQEPAQLCVERRANKSLRDGRAERSLDGVGLLCQHPTDVFFRIKGRP